MELCNLIVLPMLIFGVHFELKKDAENLPIRRVNF
jgi:hypothetical protein